MDSPVVAFAVLGMIQERGRRKARGAFVIHFSLFRFFTFSRGTH
jgi:hypothetical protein